MSSAAWPAPAASEYAGAIQDFTQALAIEPGSADAP